MRLLHLSLFELSGGVITDQETFAMFAMEKVFILCKDKNSGLEILL